jgi:hypothetical protein
MGMVPNPTEASANFLYSCQSRCSSGQCRHRFSSPDPNARRGAQLCGLREEKPLNVKSREPVSRCPASAWSAFLSAS